MIAFIIGIIIGACLGFMVTALVAANNIINHNKGGQNHDD